MSHDFPALVIAGTIRGLGAGGMLTTSRLVGQTSGAMVARATGLLFARRPTLN